MEAVKQDLLLEELNNTYGLGKTAKDTLTSYCEYVKLKQQGQITDEASYNIFLKAPEDYTEIKNVIDFICNTLKYYNAIDEDDCYEVKQSEITRKLDKIENKLLIVADKVNLNMLGTVDLLSQFIKNNPNKIFIIVFTPDKIKRFPKVPTIEEITKLLFAWNVNITGTYTAEEKKNHIQQKLKENHIRISDRCNLIDELIKLDVNKINSEILYLCVKCKANDVKTINDQFLQKVNRSKYVKKANKYGKSAMQELDEMIGLEPIKAQIKQIVNYVKVNKSRGQLPMLHMCFSGSSGVGKSEVAKLVAKIFQEEHILDGNFVEATRADLVGEYVGHTAPKTREIINRALSGVLFLDEIYSLDPKDSGKDFGHEAISELIKGMEDNRNNLCVILAGYDEEMENLLQSNPRFQQQNTIQTPLPYLYIK